ncbi:zinc transporter 6-like isoform X2 [Lineus longissimus]|uniref:zinc transporter 6-like isoform X2 n=1 Tax=Lineus longissimus TaxID=88925 RepID=UPI002B4E158E
MMAEGPSDVRKRGNPVADPNGMGVIHPFATSNRSFGKLVMSELAEIMMVKQAKVVLCLICINLVVVTFALYWSNSTKSMALTAYTFLAIFDLFCLLTCLLTIWVEQQKPASIFSFGYERFEVLAVFSSTMLSLLSSFFIFKESVERIFQQPEVHTGRLLLGAIVIVIYHMLATYIINNKAFNHVVDASSSSWLQEHMADVSESLCHVVPGLSKMLLPRINPFVLLGFAGGISLVVTHLLIDVYNYYAADTLFAMCIAVMTVGTMFPMAAYSGKILLQTTPSHIIGQLDKCIREASTLDGVLEFRHEHFWTLSFGTLAGSLHVRIRRDANEQMVLAHVTNRLSNIVSKLTIQIFKDDWTTRTSVYQMLANSGIPGNYAAPGSSSPSRGPSPPVPLHEQAPNAPPRPAAANHNTNSIGQNTNPRSVPELQPGLSMNAPLVPNVPNISTVPNFDKSYIPNTVSDYRTNVMNPFLNSPTLKTPAQNYLASSISATANSLHDAGMISPYPNAKIGLQNSTSYNSNNLVNSSSNNVKFK